MSNINRFSFRHENAIALMHALNSVDGLDATSDPCMRPVCACGLDCYGYEVVPHLTTVTVGGVTRISGRLASAVVHGTGHSNPLYSALRAAYVSHR